MTEALGREIVRALNPRRVRCAGAAAQELAEALAVLGIEVAPAGAVDLVVVNGPVDASAVADLAAVAPAILFAGAELPLAAVRLLASLGFETQVDSPGGGALFRRAPAGLAAVDQVLESQRAAIDRLEGRIALAEQRIDEIFHSRIWRTLCALSAPLIKVAALVRGIGPGGHQDQDAYARWIEAFERPGDASRFKALAFRERPLISVLMPVYRTAPLDFERAVASVRAQSYANWELCLADDGSESETVRRLLADAAASDTRIRTTALARHGGISAASNAALALARGDYIALLDHDDELAPDALFSMVDAINRHPAAGVLYSDEDKIDAAGRRFEPFFKPDWSPDLLLSENYCCHFLVARRDLVEQAGGFRSEFDPAQDYDLILRLSERTAEVAHIPRVLYHWRAVPGSCAADRNAKPAAVEARRRTVEDHLRRCSPGATAVLGCGQDTLRARYPIPSGSRAAILIPSGGNVAALRTCLESLTERTTYRDYEVVLIDNSRGREIDWMARTRGLRCLDWRGRPFNYSAMNNAAARECGAPLLVFLNDDTEVIEPGWLEAMIELGARPEVGAVGAKLLYPDGRIQHAGVVLDILRAGGHLFRGSDNRARPYFDFPHVIRNVSAVTGACMLVRAEAFESAGGFDEAMPVSFNDIDLCLRLRRLGLRNLYTPHAVLHHHESLSRARRNLTYDPAGFAALRARWGNLLDADPYYSPNLTRTSEDCSIRRAAGA
jgi:GT2 family glycosyltransferase